jgi:serine/threonine protein kinase
LKRRRRKPTALTFALPAVSANDLNQTVISSGHVFVARIARGGNGEVWRAHNSNGQEVAVKLLMKIKPIAYKRFQSEVKVLQSVRGISGILPVLAFELPDNVESSRPWYAMPLAIPLLHGATMMDVNERVRAIADVAATMRQLHDRNISHRDIKPSNLLMFEARCHIGDFGLVDYPNKEDLTGNKEQLGPIWTMAPEVRRDGRRADPKPADVYSLAKTLWIILTGTAKGFDGQFSKDGELEIVTACGELYVTPLENLLASATEHSPAKRPTMAQFEDSLREWLSISAEYQKHNPLQWKEALQELFPSCIPSHAEWQSIDGIVATLNMIANIPDLNHLFFPDSGGMDFDRVTKSDYEPGCIELHTTFTNLLKPLKLYFESFDGDPQWNYFRLECSALDPSGVYSDYAGRPFEELTDLGNGSYVDRAIWDENSYNGEPLPEGARVLIRWFGGAFVIFQKTSQYNRGSGRLDAYDGRHNKMNADEFREYIRKYKAAFDDIPRRRRAENG